jgi:hypothetical protein
VGKTVAEALPEIVSQGLIDVLMNVSRTGKPYIAHAMPMHLSDGEGSTTDVRYLTYIYQPIRNMQGRTTGVLCIGYDVTESRADALVPPQRNGYDGRHPRARAQPAPDLVGHVCRWPCPAPGR